MIKNNQQKNIENMDKVSSLNTGKIQGEIGYKKPPKEYQFKPGQSGNAAGKEKGTKNFSTLFDEAIKKIIKEKKLPITNPEVDLVVKAIVEALKGNYVYYRDIMDRRYGQPTKPIDLATGGELLFQPTPEERERALRALRDIND